MTRLIFLTMVLLVAAGAALGAAPPERTVTDDQVREVAANLRCVVCQSLSVADSPSETASEMRAIVREQLAAGQTPEQVTTYFVERYGTWILLAPPRRGFNLLVWVVPFAGLALGLVLAVLAMRRWSRRSAAAAPPTAVDEATRERIRREMAELDS